jgi:aminopeptidase-like protein
MEDFLSKTAHLNRAIVSDDFEKTLKIIGKRIPLVIHRYPTGTQCFDWIIPKKWIIRDAYIIDDKGNKILDWKKHPLHVVIGSLPIDKTISREELLKKTYVSETYPNLIPYRFKYYELDWGFCMAKQDLDVIQRSKSFRVVIDSAYVDDNLLVGEHVIEGESKKSIMLLSHIDHPAQVNDDLGGAAVLLRLAEELNGTRPAYTLRFHFLPERIGSIAYLYHKRKNLGSIMGGIFCEMPGTPKYPIALQYSKWKDTRLDRIARYVLERFAKQKPVYGDCFKYVMNDEAFYNSPGIDIPCLSLSRAKPFEHNDISHFPGYHTSGDNLENFDLAQANEFLTILKKILSILNRDRLIIRNFIGVPHLSRHNLWVNWQEQFELAQHIDDILHNLDNRTSIFDIAEKANMDFNEVYNFVKKMENVGLVRLITTETVWFSRENPWAKLASR